MSFIKPFPDWQTFQRRADNRGLNVMQVKQKYLTEQYKYYQMIPPTPSFAAAPGGTNAPAGPTFTNTFSVAFDGSDDRAETSVNYSEFDGETKGTFSFWFKLNGNYSNNNHLAKVGPPYASKTFEHQLLVSGDTTYKFLIAQGTSGKNVSVNLGNLRTDGLWHNLIFCVDLSLSTDADKTKLFFDGDEETLSGAVTLSSFPSHPATLTVGGTTQGNNSFPGNIDEVAFWAGVDLRDDIATIYNSGVPNDLNNNGLTLPTTYYRMGDNNGGTGTTITDNGTTNYDLSFVGEPVFETDVPEA